MHHLILSLSVPHTEQENWRFLRSQDWWRRSSALRKKKGGEKKHLPGETFQGIGGRERWVKWAQFQRGNNGGHGVWCSYAGHENDSVDDGINHTSAALNVNEDVFACFLAFLITMLASNQPSSHPDGGGGLICSHAGWYRLTEAIIFEMFLLSFFLRSLLLLCFCCDEWAQGQNGVYPLISPASPDKRNAHSRWHYFGVCTPCATAPFISCELKFTTYPLTGGVNISNMTQAVILLGKQKRSCLSPETERIKAPFWIFYFYFFLPFQIF